MLLRLVVGLAVAFCLGLALLWWWNPCLAPEITVTNASESHISQVVISGSGFNESLGDLAPGSSTTRSVRCAGESGLELSFSKAGKSYSRDDLAYIESCGGYRVDLTVKADTSVAVSQRFAY